MKRILSIASLIIISSTLAASTFTLRDGSTITGTIQSEDASSYQVLVTVNKSDIVKQPENSAPQGFAKPAKITPASVGNFELTQGSSVMAPINTDRFRQAAVRALANRGYRIVEEIPGVITYKLQRSNYDLTMKLCYYTDEYWYQYVDSHNLDADPVRNRIHRNYYRWIRNLEKDILENY